jgi:hypothetical protein
MAMRKGILVLMRVVSDGIRFKYVAAIFGINRDC